MPEPEKKIYGCSLPPELVLEMHNEGMGDETWVFKGYETRSAADRACSSSAPCGVWRQTTHYAYHRNTERTTILDPDLGLVRRIYTPADQERRGKTRFFPLEIGSEKDCSYDFQPHANHHWSSCKVLGWVDILLSNGMKFRTVDIEVTEKWRGYNGALLSEVHHYYYQPEMGMDVKWTFNKEQGWDDTKRERYELKSWKLPGDGSRNTMDPAAKAVGFFFNKLLEEMIYCT